MKYLTTFFLLFSVGFITAQTNILITNSEADAILHGNFDPTSYLPDEIIDDPYVIAADMLDQISADSLKSYLEVMSSFETRHTASDTLSSTTGIGAARRWALDKLTNFNQRLVATYVQFEVDVCGMETHRNPMAILPGTGLSAHELVLVEAHFDSRCGESCDTECIAHGMEDNGSGSALVLELARVMSKYTFDRTLVFMLTTGEEQGLWGAEAFSAYCQNENLPITAVYNNDIVGGIICGATASPPGCPGLNDIDSTNVRIYSSGNLNSRNKLLARFVKLEYEEMIAPQGTLMNQINIMSPEDRTGRGGDHIPFRERGYTAIRFTSANEHGNVATSNPDYEDRQHTSEDLLGVDTDNDGILDSFFVDFNYLARNTLINANAIAMTALGPRPPLDFSLSPINGGFEIEIDDPNNYNAYRIGVRSFNNLDFDTLLTINNSVDTLRGLAPNELHVISVATLNDDGIESLFIGEKFDNFQTSLSRIAQAQAAVTLLQNRPNPFDEATYFGVMVREVPAYQSATIQVRDLQGRILAELPINLQLGLNEVIYDFQNHQYQPGVYTYTLILDGYPLITKRMMYAY